NKLNKNIKNLSITNDIKQNVDSINPNEIKPNTDVFVTTLNQNGLVISHISKSNEVQVQIGSMKMNINIKYLEKARNVTKPNNSNKSTNLNNSTSSYTSISKSRTAKSEINVIGLNVEEAIFVVDKFLDDSILAKLQTVRIVHGKGTGKLKNGIHQFLKKNLHVKSYRMGTYGEGEMGVTVVELK
ncbi:MAG: endonuclease MutS2, partial [Clostridia bacterium]|nr:endonuclease MutS2 [Clostridia bacterium]